MELASIRVVLFVILRSSTPILAVQAPSGAEVLEQSSSKQRVQPSSLSSQESKLQLVTTFSLVENKGSATIHAKPSQSQAAFFQDCDGFQVKACGREFETDLVCVCNIQLWVWLLVIPFLSAFGASICLVIAICYLQSVRATRATPEECDPVKLLEYQLIEVKWQGLLRRLEVSAPVLIWGFALISFGLPTVYIYNGVSRVYWLAIPTTLVGFTVSTAALLPTDTRTIKVTCLLFICLLCVLETSMVPRLLLTIRDDGDWFADNNLMVYRYYKILCHAIDCILCPALTFFLLYHLCFSPMRVVLASMWKAIGYFALDWSPQMLSLLVWYALDSNLRNSWENVHSYQKVSCLYCCVVTGINTYACLSPNLRHAIRDTLTADSQEAATAAGVANMICHMDPLEVLKLAQSTFTCVPADRLTREDMAENTPNPRLRALAQPAKFGCVDAFMSHSWSDDAEAKWNALQAWRQSFKDLHGEEPRLWIDKYCIDQNNITESLACLPVYLSGCKKLLVLSGDTYLSRLWCVLELFVFLEMNIDVSDFEVRMLGEKAAVASTAQEFHLEHARCYAAETTEMLMGVIDAGGADMRKKLTSFVKDKFK